MNDCPHCNGNGEIEEQRFYTEAGQQRDNDIKDYTVCPVCNGNGALEEVNG
ncbi:hypothetical protein EDD68_1107 [Melghiribacillus thermohalophilus]|uniref:Molecular chaperone DnaJ n=1 Tax=Melghiribacillus thermohalophilus TaxID=1324956 RepID=A0A4R3N3Q3_9BACI|nr:hypothetical protein [Melghiribacillus thermohalophilus]TCT21703.1 hypothetical protein EDD68_1107 [Melghiribacillus thermohalophilus]